MVHKQRGFLEFVLLAAALLAIQALAIDAMLPALPGIVRDLHVGEPNHGQWVITIFMAGVGLGQLFWGLMSDRFGRRPILLLGVFIYVVAAFACALTMNFPSLLLWRLIHGLAAASMVVTRSVVRDLYSGRSMARVMSLTFVVFLIVPVVAPTLGQGILLVWHWQAIFLACGAIAMAVGIWAAMRLPETLHPEFRLELSGSRIMAAAKLVLSNRQSVFYALASTMIYGALLAYVSTVQQIFAKVFFRAELMPSMFALGAAMMAVAAFLNSRFVEKLGMRRISHSALLAFIGITGLHVLIALLGYEKIWTFVVLQSLTMASFSLSVPNFGAMAMEPMGSVAGMAASLQGFVTSLGGAIVGSFIGRFFDGSTLPLALGACSCGMVALVFVLIAESGRLFHSRHA